MYGALKVVRFQMCGQYTDILDAQNHLVSIISDASKLVDFGLPAREDTWSVRTTGTNLFVAEYNLINEETGVEYPDFCCFDLRDVDLAVSSAKKLGIWNELIPAPVMERYVRPSMHWDIRVLSKEEYISACYGISDASSDEVKDMAYDVYLKEVKNDGWEKVTEGSGCG